MTYFILHCFDKKDQIRLKKLTDFLSIPPTTINYGLFSQIENSTPITATSDELSLIANGFSSSLFAS
jgi:hypothetical protein